MRATIPLHHYMDVGHDWASHHVAALTLVGGVLVAALLLTFAEPLVEFARSSAAAPTAVQPAVEYPPPELAREWRWQPSGVAVEHMYRRYDEQRLDWIRNSGAR
jgi:hypothetical protein